jgi:hypothetical protein
MAEQRGYNKRRKTNGNARVPNRLVAKRLVKGDP